MPSYFWIVNCYDFCLSIITTFTKYCSFSSFKLFLAFEIWYTLFLALSDLFLVFRFLFISQIVSSPLQFYQEFQLLSSFVHYAPLWDVWRSCFWSNMLILIATIWKCPDFLPKMSGILDTRIPTYCNSGSAKLSKYIGR